MFNSIRTKLTLWYVGVLALVLMSFAVLTYVMVVNSLTHQTDETLTEMARNFKTSLEDENNDENKLQLTDKDIREAVSEAKFRDYEFIVETADDSRIASTLPNSRFTPDLLKSISLNPSRSTINVSNRNFRVFQLPLNYGENSYHLYIFYSLHENEEFLSRFRTIFLIAVPVALILAALGGYFLARRSLAPVIEMGSQAVNIGATNLHERLIVRNDRDELGQLAHIFNRLLTRLENSFDQQRRFMADASHELRTPLSIVRGESEVALSKKGRPNNELRESLSIVHDESKRLTKIVEDLFTLARADAGQFKTNFTEFYLDEILTDCVRAVRVLAEKRKIKIEFAAIPEMPVRGDEYLLRRLFINLLDNAIKYNHPQGTVFVKAEKSGNTFRITIADKGIGIEAVEQSKIFERFYRSDKSRTRSHESATSGAGLGLSIVRWITEIHQGTVELVSSGEDGSIFSVQLPAPEQSIS